mgnify:CR=1 FL=1
MTKNLLLMTAVHKFTSAASGIRSIKFLQPCGFTLVWIYVDVDVHLDYLHLHLLVRLQW